MFKRTVILVGLLLAFSAPAALADSGSAKRRLDRLHDRIQMVTKRFAERCENGKADSAKCEAVAKRMVDRLQEINRRIDAAIAKAKRPDVVERLHTLQSQVQELTRRLQAYRAKAPVPAGLAPAAAGTTGTDTSGLESLDQLAADLAAAQAAAGN